MAGRAAAPHPHGSGCLAGGPVGEETVMVEDDYGPWDD